MKSRTEYVKRIRELKSELDNNYDEIEKEEKEMKNDPNNSEHQTKINSCNVRIRELDYEFIRLGNELHNYSCLPTNMANFMFEMCLTYVEGIPFVQYSPRLADYYEASIIVSPEAKNIERLDKEENFKEQNLLGNAIQLSSGFGSMVALYDFCGFPESQFGPYNYLNDLVDELIQYRIDNRIGHLRYVRMDIVFDVLSNFLVKHKDLLEMHRVRREKLFANEEHKEDSVLLCRKFVSECNITE